MMGFTKMLKPYYVSNSQQPSQTISYPIPNNNLYMYNNNKLRL